jgi:hypothetical protein
MSSHIPLAWRFAEKISDKGESANLESGKYNARLSVNTIELDGVETPIVTIKDTYIGTTTLTESRAEGSDQDLDALTMLYGTSTVTRAEREATDED